MKGIGDNEVLKIEGEGLDINKKIRLYMYITNTFLFPSKECPDAALIIKIFVDTFYDDILSGKLSKELKRDNTLLEFWEEVKEDAMEYGVETYSQKSMKEIIEIVTKLEKFAQKDRKGIKKLFKEIALKQ